MNRLHLTFVAVGCGPKEFGSLCDDPQSAPETCNSPCDPLPGAANSCPSGWHCAADGFCNAQCTTSGGQCGDGYVCTADGRCVGEDVPPENGPDANCPAVNFTPMPTTPSIELVLDQSGSMFPPQSTYYTQMREALVGATGVITSLESKAYFGSLLYTCNGNNNAFTETARALNNAATIRASIDSKTSGENTPTHAAIMAATTGFTTSPPPMGSPPIIILATDGLPNSCNGGGGTGPTVQAAAAAYAAGIPVYVLAIGNSDSHFQDVANAGQGWQPGQPNVTYYPVQNAAQLQAAFQTIINGVISCDLSLTATIDDGQAMNGTVVVNGVTLQYGVDWILVNGNVIRVQGNACNMLKNSMNPMVSAQFPCGSVIF